MVLISNRYYTVHLLQQASSILFTDCGWADTIVLELWAIVLEDVRVLRWRVSFKQFSEILV